MSAALYTVAVEEHYAIPEILDATRHVAGPEVVDPGGPRFRQLVDLGEERIAAMDEAGVDLQVLSHTAPGLEHVVGPDAPALARAANDVVLDAIARHPTRFAGFAALPVSDPVAATEELRRAVARGLVGALINGSSEGVFLDDPRYDDLLAAAAELAVPLYVHPGVPPAAVTQAYYGGFAAPVSAMFAASAWGWHADTAVHVLRLVLAGVFDRHPGLQVIIGHMGEMLPVMLDRAHTLLTPLAGLQRPVRDYLTDHVHISVAGVYSPPAFQATAQTWGIGRIMFATDYPYVPAAPGTMFLESISLSPDDRRALAADNAMALLGLPGPDVTPYE